MEKVKKGDFRSDFAAAASVQSMLSDASTKHCLLSFFKAIIQSLR